MDIAGIGGRAVDLEISSKSNTFFDFLDVKLEGFNF